MLILGFVFSIYMYIIGLIVFCSNRKHLLLILLSLEFIVLSLYFLIIIYLRVYNYEFFFRIVFLTLRVCESSLGLAILVSIIRTHGNDYFQNFNVLW